MQKEIISLQNPFVKHCSLLRKEKEYRLTHRQLMIFGKKMCEELSHLEQFAQVLIVQGTPLPKGIKAESMLIVTEEILKKISGLTHVEPIAAVIKIPSFHDLKMKKRVIALDGISDPGNLGTLIRTAHALGWDGVFITADSCDPFNDKALRAAKGATFHLPIEVGSHDRLKELMQDRVCIAADPKGNETLPDHTANNGLILILGSESHGLRKEIQEGCFPLSIPMAEHADSLNVAVAGGILMSQLIKSCHV